MGRLNKDRLKEVLKAYKDDFLEMQWPKEEYKWKAVRHFQDHWDINAENFSEMFAEARKKADNLLASSHYFPGATVESFAKEDSEATRAMFMGLFDENKNLMERIEKFQSDAEMMRAKYDDGTLINHFQNTNAISTYLWLRYPNKYYIYKYSIVREAAKTLDSEFKPKKGSVQSVLDSFEFFDGIREYLSKDEALLALVEPVLTDEHYEDTSLNTLTQDVALYIAKEFNQDDSEWYPKDYTPGISVEEWSELLENPEVFNPSALAIMKRMMDYGGQATCKQLSIKYGEPANFYNAGSSTLAKKVAKETDCPLITSESGQHKWWPVLYVGKHTGNKEKGNFIWKLRDNLLKALKAKDLSHVPLYTDTSADNQAVNHWWLSANPKIWSFSSLAVGETHYFTKYNEHGNQRRIHQNFIDASPGDYIIGYESQTVKQAVALLKVTHDTDEKYLVFEKLEGFSNPVDYHSLRACPELEKMEFFVSSQGSLFKLTQGEYDFIIDLIRENNPLQKEEKIPYGKKDFLNEVYITEARYDDLVALLNNKMNIILQGAPGVGKTFLAKRLAYAIMGRKDHDRVELIQFHQNYAYEDFIMGYKPKGDGFELTNGVFYQFCQKAMNAPDKKHFFIIDEINRGNMSKIFGEILMLIEKGYRKMEATLAYNGTPFTVPDNLYLIGTMNTADRSLAMIDYALRRRFSFFDMEPGFNAEGFRAYQRRLNDETFDQLIETVKALNTDIANDSALGKGFMIGHSYFCDREEATEAWMRQVVEHDIIPMLNEYWFDEPSKIQKWENNLRGVFNE